MNYNHFTYAMEGIRGDNGCAKTVQDQAYHHNTLVFTACCLDVRRNVVDLLYCVELESRQCCWEGITTSLSDARWPNHTFITDKSKQAVSYKNGEGAAAKAVGPSLDLSQTERGPKPQAYLNLPLSEG